MFSIEYYGQNTPDTSRKSDAEPGEGNFFTRNRFWIPVKKVEDQPLADPQAEIKRLRSMFDKEIKTRSKLEKALKEREIALSNTINRMEWTENKLEHLEIVFKELDKDLSARTRELGKMEKELDQERYYRRKQSEEMRQMAHAKRDSEIEAEKKANLLSGKVFELTGGTFDATHDQLRGMLQAWLGGVGNLAPSFFTRVEDLSFKDPAHLQHFKQNLEERDFAILTNHRGAAYYYLCESWLFKGILEHIINVFCVGTREAFEAFWKTGGQTMGQKVDEGMQLLYKTVEDLPADTKSG